MTIATRHRASLRFRGRSFLALVLAPEPPLQEWLAELDRLAKLSPGFFLRRPMVLDVSGLAIDKPGLAALVAELQARDIRLMGIEGAKPSMIGPDMPPLMSGGRTAGDIEPPTVEATPITGLEVAGAVPVTVIPRQGALPASIAASAEPTSLLIESPVRSGQSIIFPNGDVTVLGHIASGSEVIAGGSIHVYGALRGRALAGSTGNAAARIFCRRLEAELLAIDGLYHTADDMKPEFRDRPVQVWLEGDAIKMAALA